MPGVEPIAAAHRAQPMIHSLRCGLGLLLELMTDIGDERGFGDLRERLVLRFKPASKVEQVISVNAN